MLKFLFWLFIIYIVYRVLTGFIFPFLLRNYIRKQQRKYSPNDRSENSTQTNKGEVRITIPRQKNRGTTNVSDKIGEYTEFEEQEQEQEKEK